MGKKKFTIEEKIKAVELHIREGMGYGGISDRFGVPITTLRHWIQGNGHNGTVVRIGSSQGTPEGPCADKGDAPETDRARGEGRSGLGRNTVGVKRCVRRFCGALRTD